MSLWSEWAETHELLRQGHEWRKDPKEGACSKCGNAVWWVLTEKGKNMPLDPDPTAYGRFSFTGYERDRRPIVHYVSNYEPVTGELLYRSHFASCEPEPDVVEAPPIDEYERFM